MNFYDRIEEWATAQGIDDWTDSLKEWASNELAWDEYCEMELMTMGLDVVGDQGGYPSEEALKRAFDALGYSPSKVS